MLTSAKYSAAAFPSILSSIFYPPSPHQKAPSDLPSGLSLNTPSDVSLKLRLTFLDTTAMENQQPPS
jgi:hypothetical protein